MLFFIWVQYIHGFCIECIHPTLLTTLLTLLKYLSLFYSKICILFVMCLCYFTIIWRRRHYVFLTFLWNFNHRDFIVCGHTRTNVSFNVAFRVHVVYVSFFLLIRFYIWALFYLFLLWVQLFDDLWFEYVPSTTKIFTKAISSVSKRFTPTKAFLCDLVTTYVKPYVIRTVWTFEIFTILWRRLREILILKFE